MPGGSLAAEPSLPTVAGPQPATTPARVHRFLTLLLAILLLSPVPLAAQARETGDPPLSVTNRERTLRFTVLLRMRLSVSRWPTEIPAVLVSSIRFFSASPYFTPQQKNNPMLHPTIVFPRITGRCDPEPGCKPSPVWLRLSHSSTVTS